MALSVGSSAMQGAHQVAQRLISSGLPWTCSEFAGLLVLHGESGLPCATIEFTARFAAGLSGWPKPAVALLIAAASQYGARTAPVSKREDSKTGST
jgi:hypothetical protein